MASVFNILPSPREFYAELQNRADLAEKRRHKRFLAVLLLQRMTRGYLIRKHVAWLSKNATIIQCAFRVHRARKAYRVALSRAVRNKHAKYYAAAATRIQALWRGHHSRRTNFCYRTYRNWIAQVVERGERRVAESFEFGVKSIAYSLRVLEEEAKRWLAYVAFKLHHLLRTYVCAGVYSDYATNELSDFEKLLKSIQYTEYMKKLKRKYDRFVKKNRPKFSNKRLFPIIGEGADYWYLSLPEMYELTAPVEKKVDTRHVTLHHSPIHKEPFLWRKITTPLKFDSDECKGPFSSKSLPRSLPSAKVNDAEYVRPHRDPRFYLYLEHYKPQLLIYNYISHIFDYVDFHINMVLRRKCSIQRIKN